MIFHAVPGGVLLELSHNTLYHALHEHGFGHAAGPHRLSVHGGDGAAHVTSLGRPMAVRQRASAL